jgi:hypothetical protein
MSLANEVGHEHTSIRKLQLNYHYWSLLSCETLKKSSASPAQIIIYIVNNTHFKFPRVVVGAPRGNSMYPAHRNIHQPGVVYQCHIDRHNRCKQLVVDIGGELCQNKFNISIYRLQYSAILHKVCHGEFSPFILEFCRLFNPNYGKCLHPNF